MHRKLVEHGHACRANHVEPTRQEQVCARSPCLEMRPQVSTRRMVRGGLLRHNKVIEKEDSANRRLGNAASASTLVIILELRKTPRLTLGRFSVNVFLRYPELCFKVSLTQRFNAPARAPASIYATTAHQYKLFERGFLPRAGHPCHPPSAPRAHNTRPIARYVGAAVPELAPGASYETTSDREVTLFEDFHLLSSPGPSSIPHGQWPVRTRWWRSQ